MRGATAGVSPYMYEYRYDHAVSAIEKLDLDQVFSRERPSSRRSPPFGVVFC